MNQNAEAGPSKKRQRAATASEGQSARKKIKEDRQNEKEAKRLAKEKRDAAAEEKKRSVCVTNLLIHAC